jgi:ribA/ribD-fused uncharacterized protein
MASVDCIVCFEGDYAFLDNGAPAVVLLNGIEYPTLEHAYQASKTLAAEKRAIIREAPTPRAARRFGSWLTPIANWRAVRLDVMAMLIAQKFAVGSMDAERLLATADAELLYGNVWGDTFWGVSDGVGRNHLGRLLMERRDWLRAEAPAMRAA